MTSASLMLDSQVTVSILKEENKWVFMTTVLIKLNPENDIEQTCIASGKDTKGCICKTKRKDIGNKNKHRKLCWQVQAERKSGERREGGKEGWKKRGGKGREGGQEGGRALSNLLGSDTEHWWFKTGRMLLNSGHGTAQNAKTVFRLSREKMVGGMRISCLDSQMMEQLGWFKECQGGLERT